MKRKWENDHDWNQKAIAEIIRLEGGGTLNGTQTDALNGTAETVDEFDLLDIDQTMIDTLDATASQYFSPTKSPDYYQSKIHELESRVADLVADSRLKLGELSIVRMNLKRLDDEKSKLAEMVSNQALNAALELKRVKLNLEKQLQEKDSLLIFAQRELKRVRAHVQTKENLPPAKTSTLKKSVSVDTSDMVLQSSQSDHIPTMVLISDLVWQSLELARI